MTSCPCPAPLPSTRPGSTSRLSHVSTPCYRTTHCLPCLDKCYWSITKDVPQQLLFIVGHGLQHLQFQARQIVSLTLPGWWWPTRPAKKLQDLFLLIQSPVRARTRPPPGDGQDPSERGQPTGEDRGHSGTGRTLKLSFQWQTVAQHWRSCHSPQSSQLWLRWKVCAGTPAVTLFTNNLALVSYALFLQNIWRSNNPISSNF